MINCSNLLLSLMCAGQQSGMAESIFTKMDNVMKDNGIPWANCVGTAVDNTSVNVGRRNSIMTRVIRQSPNVYFMGCPCHILHNTAMKAAESFTQVSLVVYIVCSINNNFVYL